MLGWGEGCVNNGRGVSCCRQGCGNKEADVNPVFNNGGDGPISLLGGCEL